MSPSEHAHCRHESSPAETQGAPGGHGTLGMSVHATLHCLTGCSIGEITGLAIGVSLGWPVWATIALATTLAYISGFTLGLWPLVRRGHGWREAFSIIWIGEATSIAVMEIAMNTADYLAGGMTAPSLAHPGFWIGLAVAIPAGFLAAWPVNWWLLRRNLKACH